MKSAVAAGDRRMARLFKWTSHVKKAGGASCSTGVEVEKRDALTHSRGARHPSRAAGDRRSK